MRLSLVTLAGTLALAACGSPDPDTDGDGKISMEEAQASMEASGAVRPQPGQYRASVELLEFDAPGAPPNAKEMMQGMFQRTFEYCLTPEEAEKGFEEMAKTSQNGDCSFETFEADGNDMDAVMVCSGTGMGEMRVTLDGTGNETSSEMTMSMQGDFAGQGEGSMTMQTKHERIGDCPS